MKKLILCFFLLFFFYKTSFAQYTDTGIYLGMNTGTWLLTNKNGVLENPYMFGFTADAKFSDNNTLGIEFNLVAGKSKDPILFELDDIIHSTNVYGGAEFTVNYFRRLFDGQNFMFEAMIASGYSSMSYGNDTEDVSIEKEGMIINPGISLRLFTNGRLYFQLKVLYRIAGYNLKNDLNPNLASNYLVTKLVIGQTSLY